MHPRHPLSPTFLFQLTRQKQSFFLEQQHIILAELANTARKICVDGEQSVGCDGAEPHQGSGDAAAGTPRRLTRPLQAPDLADLLPHGAVYWHDHLLPGITSGLASESPSHFC
jgi:hypothetical protein